MSGNKGMITIALLFEISIGLPGLAEGASLAEMVVNSDNVVPEGGGGT